MAATVAERAELRHFSDDELAALYNASDDDAERADVLAECERRDGAKAKGAQARQAIAGEWRDAMHAQFLAAEERCAGNLLSAKGLAEGIQEPTVLWTGSERWAMARASEELRAYWDECGGRLSLALFKRQLADAKRQDREERQHASGKAPRKHRAWIGVKGGAVRETPVRLGDQTVTAWAAMGYDDDPVTIHPTRAHAERHLVPEPEPEPVAEPIPAPSPGPAVPPGAMARYITMLRITRREVDATTRSLGRMNGGIKP